MTSPIFRSLFLSLALAPLVMQAQHLFDLGPKAGISSNDLSFSPGLSTTNVMGWNVGLFARVKPPVLPGVQAEALLSTVGSDAEGGVNVRLNYVQIPGFLIFSLGPLELHAGGYYGHPLSSSVHGTLEGMDGSMLHDADSDYGLLGGVGLHLGHFYAGARYNYGLKDLNTGDGPDVRNRQAQLYVGFGLFR